MTVLTRYERLECAGIWRDSAEAQRRNVLVSMGEATLVIADSAEVALTHWSLPAIFRVNPGQRPALYRPGEDSEEELEIDDATMIDAIGTVQRALARGRPYPGRVRRGVFAAILATVLALLVLWLPGALVHHTAAVIPSATRARIGDQLLRHLEPVAGRPCASREGQLALVEFQNRLFGEGPWRIVVLRGGPVRTAHLPGEILLIHRALIEDQPTPEVAAGALLAEVARADGSDPAVALMETAGAISTFGLLTRGQIDELALADYAENLLVTPPHPVPSADLLDRFRTAEISAQPYAGFSGGTDVLSLTAGDPYPAGTPDAIVSDATWLRLQTICDD